MLRADVWESASGHVRPPSLLSGALRAISSILPRLGDILLLLLELCVDDVTNFVLVESEMICCDLSKIVVLISVMTN